MRAGPEAAKEGESACPSIAIAGAGVKINQCLVEIGDGVLEESEPVAVLFEAFPRPAGVLRAEKVPLGVRHEAKDAAGGVGKASQVALGAVGVVRKRRRFALGADIAKDCLPGLGEALKDPFLSTDEIAFAVRHGHIHLGDALEKNTIARCDEQVDPAVFKAAVAVVDERNKRPIFIRRDNQSRLDQYLKAVADAEDEFVLHAELAYGVGEEVL